MWPKDILNWNLNINELYGANKNGRIFEKSYFGGLEKISKTFSRLLRIFSSKKFSAGQTNDKDFRELLLWRA